MAYYSGIANSVNDLLSALHNSAQSDGWTLNGNILSKDTIHIETAIGYNNLKVRAGLDASMTSPSPWQHIGYIYGSWALNPWDISYPCTWEFHGFAQEVYFVVNFNVDRYQWLAFGKSTVPGLPGVGTWIGATVGRVHDEYATSNPTTQPFHITPSGGGAGSYNKPSGALFCTSFASDVTIATPNYVHHNFENYGWRVEPSSSTSYSPYCWKWIGDTGGIFSVMQPSAWNAEAVLLPLRCYFRRPSNMLSLIVDCEHARLMRIDNVSPGDILTLGPDKWKVYPWHKKNISARNGGDNIDHTGTLGWAVRYLGP